jgi:hypothetical protein
VEESGKEGRPCALEAGRAVGLGRQAVGCSAVRGKQGGRGRGGQGER